MAEATLLLATGNAGKIAELRELLHGSGVNVVGLRDISEGGMEPPAETGENFCENALLKARCWMERTGLPVLADDSGLAVDCLDGAPGIFSARYAGEGATDGDNNVLLMEKLSAVPEQRRTAAFHCCIAFCRPGLPAESFTGRADGFIATAPSGANGFGYDPLFFYPPLGRTFAQLTPAEKNAVSHRANALRKFVSFLQANPLVR